MIGKHALFGTAVLAALGVPYVLSDKVGSFSQPHSAAARGAATPENSRDFPALRNESLPLEGPAVSDLAEVLRFDITPSWLLARWPRVMNARHEAGSLQAYRVPLVTGHKEGDLAGALTYFFSEEQKLQRIEFQGLTGDAGPLVSFLSKQYGFVRRMNGHPGQFIYETRGAAENSELVVRNAPLIDASQPQARFRADLVLHRPSEHRMFSDATQHRFDSRGW